MAFKRANCIRVVFLTISLNAFLNSEVSDSLPTLRHTERLGSGGTGRELNLLSAIADDEDDRIKSKIERGIAAYRAWPQHLINSIHCGSTRLAHIRVVEAFNSIQVRTKLSEIGDISEKTLVAPRIRQNPAEGVFASIKVGDVNDIGEGKSLLKCSKCSHTNADGPQRPRDVMAEDIEACLAYFLVKRQR
ncbi:hypothetical protein H0H87_005673 [Tephrocybe sp. NHM501043]|nr:hypothetical protein H0H87_005673 [Tephrocybe sp. NHM501043]